MKGFNIGLVLYVDSQFLVTACIMAVVFTLTGVTELLPTWVITLYFFGLYGFFGLSSTNRGKKVQLIIQTKH